MLGIFLKQKFVEFSLNILEMLICNCCNLPKYQHMLSSNHTLLTQKQFCYREFSKKYFALTCFLNVPWMPGTLRCWGNTQRIFWKCAGWDVSPIYQSNFYLSRHCPKVALLERLSPITCRSFIARFTVWFYVL